MGSKVIVIISSHRKLFWSFSGGAEIELVVVVGAHEETESSFWKAFISSHLFTAHEMRPQILAIFPAVCPSHNTSFSTRAFLLLLFSLLKWRSWGEHSVFTEGPMRRERGGRTCSEDIIGVAPAVSQRWPKLGRWAPWGARVQGWAPNAQFTLPDDFTLPGPKEIHPGLCSLNPSFASKSFKLSPKRK